MIASLSSLVCKGQAIVEFRVETDVTLEDRPEPIQQSVTLLYGGMAFDFARGEPHRITVIDSINNRIIFIDSKRELQSRINLQDLRAFMESARKELVTSSMAAALDDAKLVRIDASSPAVTVGEKFFRYEAVFLHPENPAAAQLYADFADASASVNAWQYPDRSPPAFARIQLNQVLRDLHAIPTEITRTTFTSSGRQHVLQSRLHLQWQLSEEDRKTVDRFVTMMEVFRSVEVNEFMSPAKMASGSAAAR